MGAETLDGEYYRRQAYMCHKLAVAATEAGPLFARLYALARAYEKKAEAADLAGRRAIKSSGSFNPTKSFVAATR
jgi:hypothetical protein